MFDMEQFNSLDARFPELAPRLAYDFVYGGGEHVDALRRAVAAGDWDQVQYHAHTLRTSAGYLGAKEVHRLCAAIDEDPQRASLILPRFVQAYHEAAAVVRQLGEQRGMKEGCPPPKAL